MDKQHKQKAINAWVKSSEEDWEVANDLFNSRKYAYSLYFCQLALEKILKALYIKELDDYPIPTHDLTRLANKINVSLTQKEQDQLAEITTFNVEARYDIYKQKLHSKASQHFTQQYIEITKKLMNKFKLLS